MSCDLNLCYFHSYLSMGILNQIDGHMTKTKYWKKHDIKPEERKLRYYSQKHMSRKTKYNKLHAFISLVFQKVDTMTIICSSIRKCDSSEQSRWYSWSSVVPLIPGHQIDSYTKTSWSTRGSLSLLTLVVDSIKPIYRRMLACQLFSNCNWW